MKSRQLSFVIGSTLAFTAAAHVLQAASFERLHGDSAHAEAGGISTAVNACPSGGFLTLGTTTTDQLAVLAVRTAANGSVLWEKSYTFGAGIVAEAALEVRNGSGFVLAGSSASAAGLSDVFLMKVDCAGTPLWASTYPDPSGSSNGLSRLIETTNGDLVGAGFSQTLEPLTIDALLLRADATGALGWARKYDAGDFTLFEGVTEARGGHHGEGDLVVVGFRQASTDPHRPIVLRLEANGRLDGAHNCAIQYEPATVATFSAVTQLTAPGHDGDFVLAGRIEGRGALLVRTGSDVCEPVVERLIDANATASTQLAEVRVAMPGVPRGTLAVAGTVQANPQAPDDGYLLTVSPSTLRPRSAHLFGDHSAQSSVDSRFATVRSVLALSNGFAVTGDTTIGPIFDDDTDVYIAKTDVHGETPCNVPWEPTHRRVHIPTRELQLDSARADFGRVAQGDIRVETQDAHRDACE